MVDASSLAPVFGKLQLLEVSEEFPRRIVDVEAVTLARLQIVFEDLD